MWGELATRPTAFLVERFEQAGQFGLLEGVADFQRVATGIEVSPRVCKFNAECFERFVAFFLSETGWPNPLDGQRRFAPAVGGFALRVLHGHAHASAGDVGERFGAELKRHARFDGKKVERNASRMDVGLLARHGRLIPGFSAAVSDGRKK
jgi:hypothetical protein